MRVAFHETTEITKTMNTTWTAISRGQKSRTRKKNKFLGTEVPRNFWDQCSLDFAYFLCLFSGRRPKSSQELCSWELFFFLFYVVFLLQNKHQKFRKGVGRQRGLARGNPSYTRDSGLFSVPFFLCPLTRRGTNFWRTFWALLGGLFVANPFPPTPFRNHGNHGIDENHEDPGCKPRVPRTAGLEMPEFGGLKNRKLGFVWSVPVFSKENGRA